MLILEMFDFKEYIHARENFVWTAVDVVDNDITNFYLTTISAAVVPTLYQSLLKQLIFLVSLISLSQFCVNALSSSPRLMSIISRKTKSLNMNTMVCGLHQFPHHPTPML